MFHHAVVRTAIGAFAAPLALTLALFNSAHAEVPAIFKGANLKNGEALIAEHNCTGCHASKVGGDGSSIYRPLGRINTAGFLRGMVAQCNVSLNLQMFPEDVTDVAAVLNRDHYKFKH